MSDPEWIANLRKELLLAPMKNNYTFSRDEVMALLAAAAPADATRLDWLEQFHRLRATEGHSRFYGDVGTCLVERTSDGWMLDRELDRDMPEFDTLREAIDAAIAAHN